MKVKPLLRVVTLMGSILLAQSTLAAEIADYIWSGGPILTINDAQPRVEAIAIKDGKMLALGSLQDTLKKWVIDNKKTQENIGMILGLRSLMAF